MHSNDTNVEGQSLLGEIIKGVIFAGLTLATISGNALSLLALVMTGRWHVKYLIVSLAMTDLMLGVLVMPFTTAVAIKPQWIFGNQWCLIEGNLGFLLCLVSVFTITCVSIERYVLFTAPNLHFKWFRSNHDYVRYVVALTWIYAGSWTFIAWQTTRFSFSRELLNCAVDWRFNRAFTVACGVMTSCLPMSVTFFFNGKVVWQLKCWKTAETRSEENNLRRVLAEVKISRMLSIVVIAFLLCWTPYSVGGVCYLLPDCNWPEEFFTVSVFLCLLSSCINPVIYSACDRRFRRSVKFIVVRKFCMYFRKRTTQSVVRPHEKRRSKSPSLV